jgi:hypothetical protein
VYFFFFFLFMLVGPRVYRPTHPKTVKQRYTKSPRKPHQ